MFMAARKAAERLLRALSGSRRSKGLGTRQSPVNALYGLVRLFMINYGHVSHANSLLMNNRTNIKLG